jgi:zinc protease
MVFYDTLQKIITNNHPRTIPFPSKKQLNSVSLDRIFDIYKERVANAKDYTFFFIGNFSKDTLAPLIEKYIGSLPVSDKQEKWKNVDPDFPDGIKEVTIRSGMEPQSFVSLVMNEPFEWEQEKKLTLNMLEKILSIRLRKKLREEESEVYGVNARASVSRYPESEYMFQFIFGCNPAKTDTLVNIIFKEISKMQSAPPTKLEMQKAVNTFIRQRETQMEKNKFWRNVLEDHYLKNKPIKTFKAYKTAVQKVSPDNITQAAKKYLTKDHYVKLILKPEKAELKKSKRSNNKTKK